MRLRNYQTTTDNAYTKKYSLQQISSSDDNVIIRSQAKDDNSEGRVMQVSFGKDDELGSRLRENEKDETDNNTD